MPITLQDAQRMAAAAVGKAQGMGVTVAVAIGDEHGDPILLHRMDGVGAMETNIALNMAYTAAYFRSRGSELIQWAQDPWFQSVMLDQRGRIVPASGATPVQRDGRLIATVGVSGGTDKEDGAIADAAVAAL